MLLVVQNNPDSRCGPGALVSSHHDTVHSPSSAAGKGRMATHMLQSIGTCVPKRP